MKNLYRLPLILMVLLCGIARGETPVCPGEALPEPDREFRRTMQRLNEALGIGEQYEHRTGLTLQYDNPDLVVAAVEPGQGFFFLSREAADAWMRMRAAAWLDGVELIPVSAYRSPEKQAELVRKRLNAGEPLGEVLKSSTAPGYSEHHTGDAIDLTGTQTRALDESFAKSEAFAWLSEHAREYCFQLSYPEHNVHGVMFEPWHWRFMREPSRR